MTQRQRIEDLGVLSEKLDNLSKDELFDLIYTISRRPKDFYETFENLSDDRKEELLDEIAYGLERIKEKICECYFIASGKEEE